MPFAPELFSAPALERLEKRQHGLESVPYFDGLMAGEPDALVKSFAGVPELHDPIRGRVKGTHAFEGFVSESSSWLRQHNFSVENVAHSVTAELGFEEVILHFDAQGGRVDLPVAIVANRRPDRRIEELRIYFSCWPIAARHVNRPPLLQPDPQLRASDVVGEYQLALAAGDVDAILDAFEPDGYAREPAGGRYIHRGRDGLRSFYESLLSNGGGIPLEHCAVIDDGTTCVLEYNVVRWGQTELPPQAGVAVYVRGASGKLAAARIYDDTDPPLGPPM
jgi:hypothetical protein